MKATYQGLTMEGTAKEIAELVRLVKEGKTTPNAPYHPRLWPYWSGGGNYMPGMTGITSYNTTMI